MRIEDCDVKVFFGLFEKVKYRERKGERKRGEGGKKRD